MIRSKAYVSTEEMGDQYCLIGPYKEQHARTEVEDGPLASEPLNKAVEVLRSKGFKVKMLCVNSNLIHLAFIRFTQEDG